jgi:hypothetical protein
MQDTQNLRRKETEYMKMIAEFKRRGKTYEMRYWQWELKEVRALIEERKKNRRKNKKQYRKAN